MQLGGRQTGTPGRAAVAPIGRDQDETKDVQFCFGDRPGAGRECTLGSQKLLAAGWQLWLRDVRPFFGPFGFVDVGAITLNCNGTLGGFEMGTHTIPPYPTDAVQGTSNPITGTWSLDDDAINGTITSDSIVSPGGVYHFVVDDGGAVLRLSEVGGVYEAGRAVRQDPNYIAKVIAGKVKGGNTSFQCAGYLPNFPFPDFANGAPVSIIGTEVTDKNGYLFKGIESGNFFSNDLTSTTPPTSTVNADGTGTGTDTFGTPVILVVTAPGEDFFTVPLNPDFLGYCVVHPR